MLTEMLSLVPAALCLSHASIALHTVKIKNKTPQNMGKCKYHNRL